MTEEELTRLRDEIGDYCFDHCDLMKMSEEYMTCTLHKKNQITPTCKLWEFLNFNYQKYHKRRF
jgi:hypothetical protein